MRMITLLALSGLCLFTATSGSFAADRGDDREHSDQTRYRRHRSGHVERLTRDQREYEHIRAESADPTGSYRAYPDWARAALGDKGGRR